jgi:hypothetical protein
MSDGCHYSCVPRRETSALGGTVCAGWNMPQAANSKSLAIMFLNGDCGEMPPSELIFVNYTSLAEGALALRVVDEYGRA